MDMVKLTVLMLTAAASLVASDFSIEIGSPSAAISPDGQNVRKAKTASFSIRAKDCPDARFTGTSLSESNSKQRTEDLLFLPGTVTGSYSVVKPSQGYGAWVAVITADCGGRKLGVLVPVSVTREYDRAAAKFVPHAPTPAEMESMLRTTLELSR
jgi:hypothetical protein